MKRILAGLVFALVSTIAYGQTAYSIFEPGGALSGTWNSQNVNLAAGGSFITGLLPPANGGLGVGPITGIVKGSGVGYGAAGVSDILNLFSGTCSSTTVLHGAGTCGAVNLGTDVTSTLGSINGGSGVSDPTAHGVLIAEGPSPFNPLTMAADTFLQGTGTSSDPRAGSLVNCVGTTSALNYSTSSHAFSCETIAVGTGTVTSVGLTMPSIFAVGGSPITSSGTLAVSLNSQLANTVFAAPNGTNGTPTFRALVASDIPSISLNSNGNGGVNGVLPAPSGGTGWNSYAVGDILYAGTGTSLAKLNGNSSTTTEFLASTGTGTSATAPVWQTISTSNISTTLNGVLKGNGSGLTTAAASDIYSLWGGTCSSSTFLRGDGTCASPGSGSPGGSSGQFQYNNAGAFGGASSFTYNSSTGEVDLSGPFGVTSTSATQCGGSPAIGAALCLTPNEANNALAIRNESTAAGAYGLLLEGSPTTSNDIMRVYNHGGTSEYFLINGVGDVIVNSSSDTGDAFQATGASSHYAARIIGASTSPSYGLRVTAGSSTSDVALNVQNGAATATYFAIDGAGNITAPNATSVPWPKAASCWITGTSGTPSITASRGTVSCSTVSKNSTGNYTVNFGSGFSNRPICTFGGTPSGNPSTLIANGPSGTGSSINIVEANTSGSSADGDFMMICIGT